MPTVKVVDLVTKAGTLLQDTAATRWTKSELLGWFNDAQRELALVRPDASIVYAAFTCVAGSKQTLPSAALRLLTVVRNTNGNAITQVDRGLLDNHAPGWQSETQDSVLEHFVYDPLTPKLFWLYPPAAASASIDIIYTSAPAIVVSAQSDLSDISSTVIGVDDVYANALLDYMLYRAYAKDLNVAGSGQRAMMHLQLFQQALGARTQVDGVTTPVPRPER